MRRLPRVVLVLALLGCASAFAPATSGAGMSPASGAPGELNTRAGDLATPLATAQAEPPRSEEAPGLCGPEAPVVLEALDPTSGEPLAILKGEVQLQVTATQPVIASVAFQVAAEGPNGGWTPWTTIKSETAVPEKTRAYTLFNTATETATAHDGVYKLRAVVTDLAGHVCAPAPLEDRLIANDSATVELGAPSAPLHGEITLTAKAVEGGGAGGGELAPATFEWSPADRGEWTQIKTVRASGNGHYEASFDTAAVPDGSYDFRVVPATEAGKVSFVSVPVRGRLVDNTPPQVEMISPGSRLEGVVTLQARADDATPGSPGSGVRAVEFFQRAAGTANPGGLSIGRVTVPSGGDLFSYRLHTEKLRNGRYDFFAKAADGAGNKQVSKPIEGVAVENPAPPPALPAHVSGEAAPAQEVRILGTVPAGKSPIDETETWAYGFTSAPAAEVAGSRLEYTAEGHQFVLLRHTEKLGWQIDDVLRNEGGETAFPLQTGFLAREVKGAMAPSGEAWIWIAEGSRTAGLFHRAPGGRFEYDQKATQELWPLVSSLGTGTGLAEQSQLRIEQAGANTYGILVAPEQPVETPSAAGHCEGLTGVKGRVRYGYLKNGSWTLEQAEPLPCNALKQNDTITLALADVAGAGDAWGAFQVEEPGGGRKRLILGHLHGERHPEPWEFVHTGLDALDFTGALANAELNGEDGLTALKAEGNAVWIGASIRIPPETFGNPVVARFDGSTGTVTDSWCSLPVPNSCEEPLDAAHPAAVPDATFPEDGQLALALQQNFVDIFDHGRWSQVPAPGHRERDGASFTSPDEGWLGGEQAVARWSTESASSALVSWPLPDRSTLTSVALPPGSHAEVSEAGALAVGLHGTALSYSPANGWLAQPAPPRLRRLNLVSVAFAGPASAFAVGQGGAIMRWNGSAWSEDPQSLSLTPSQLNAVAFAPSGEGWAVGAHGTILHYNGQSWSVETPPPGDSGVEISSVTVAGSEAFAVAAGTLITRLPRTGWCTVGTPECDPGVLEEMPGSLRAVAGLPDGGLVAGGHSLMLMREGPGQRFHLAPQPIEGIAIALAPYRQADGELRTFASIAPPAFDRGDVGGAPPGDGELLRQTESGWEDLSRAQYAGSQPPGDGALHGDPVLAVATGANGGHAWAVGGYAGAVDAADQGTAELLASRPPGWQTASIWRYDTTGGAQPPALTTTPPGLPAQAGTVSFAFFSSAICREECAKVLDAQPDVNLNAAASQIATYAQQPGGPAFAMLGGNARGSFGGAADFARLPELLAPLGNLPTFAALGPQDYAAGQEDRTQPWAEAFVNSPPPFGSGEAAAGITPVSSPGEALTPDGVAHRYYAFDASQSGGRVRVIVLDNSQGSLDAAQPTSSGQTQRAWLEAQLASADSEHLPVVVMAGRPLRRAGGEGASDGEELASLLARDGVLAVFTSNPSQQDEYHLIPENPGPGVPRIAEYEGASLGYQQPDNNGVLWYFVSVDTHSREVHVAGVPVIDSLALKPLQGLTVARSVTLQFEAIGRRPPGTLATMANEEKPFPGYENYVSIPAPECGPRLCVPPSYTFASSDPSVGTFVEASGPGSRYPKLDSSRRPIASAASGLFCAYNAGTTTVSVTAGLLSYSLPVTVNPGGAGAPCGIGLPPEARRVENLRSSETQSGFRAPAPPPPPPAAPIGRTLPTGIITPPPAPGPAPAPTAPAHGSPPAAAPPPTPANPALAPPAKPAVPLPSPAAPPPGEPPLPVPPESLSVPPVILPTVAPAIEPIPPGVGGYAQSPSAAERREKARKRASQSAFTILANPGRARATGPLAAGDSPEPVWFYWAAGLATLLALMLSARGLRGHPRHQPVLLRRSAGERRASRKR